MMKWIEGWYSSYALLGVAAAGLLPILLPLEVVRTTGVSQLGIVLAAFSFGGLTAPLWGRLADSRRLHRALLAGGLACIAVGAAVFPLLGTDRRPSADFHGALTSHRPDEIKVTIEWDGGNGVRP